MMIRSLVLAAGAALSLAACSDASPVATRASDAAPLLAAQSGGIGGSYIVVLNDGADPRSVAAVAGVSPRHLYMAALNGFSASLNAGQLSALRHNPNVAYVEQDQEVEPIRISAVLPATVPWGLDRIDQRSLPLDGSYGRTRLLPTGAGVRAYVIDTGIQIGNTEFGARASNVFDAFGGTGQDCNGHGTGVAAVIGGRTYGVAKGVQLYGLRVLDCAGSGTTSGIIAGMDWVRMNHVKPAVAHMSVSGASSTALNTAANSLVNAGVTLVAAAGNGNADACGVSPASVPAVLAVAASTITDARATFSNHGGCVDLYAPGANIPTISLTGPVTRSSTAMASAHTAGAAVLYRQSNPTVSVSTLNALILNGATPNLISGNPPGTPNRLLYLAL